MKSTVKTSRANYPTTTTTNNTTHKQRKKALSIMNMKLCIPRAYLGTMTFGWSQRTSSYVDESVAIEMVKRFIQFNEELYKNNETDDSNDTTAGLLQHRIDTARIYAGGKTEHIVGTVLEQVHAASPSTTFLVGTKAAPSVKPYGLSPEGMREQFTTSMTALGGSSSSSSSSLSAFSNGCAEYYLHQPDTDHPLLESLRCADALHKEQKIHTIGMSNYHVTEVARAFQLCREHDLTPPTVYQGLYNPLNRLVEEDLLPLLKAHNCAFVAYNPLVSSTVVVFVFLIVSDCPLVAVPCDDTEADDRSISPAVLTTCVLILLTIAILLILFAHFYFG